MLVHNIEVRPTLQEGANRTSSTAAAVAARCRVRDDGAATTSSRHKLWQWSHHPRRQSKTWRILTSRTMILLCLMLYLVTYKTLHDLMEDYASASPVSQSSDLPPFLRSRSNDHEPQQQQQRRASIRASYDPSSTSTKNASPFPMEWHNPYHLVHVVQTRFMQHQPNLTTLAQVRLQLFRIFCAPLLKSSTSTSFVWTIRIDPQLDSTIVQQLIQRLEQTQQQHRSPSPQAQVLVIASNDNPKFRHEVPDPTKLVYGNIQVWESYYTASLHHTVLETRLDADDGIPHVLVEQLQRQIYQYLQHEQKGSGTRSQVRVYCVDAHIEWHQPDPNNAVEDATVDNSTTTAVQSYASSSVLGQLVGIRTPHCVTPGLTFVYPPGFEDHTHEQEQQRPQPLDATMELRPSDEEEEVEEHEDEDEQRDLPTKHHLIHKQWPQCVDTHQSYDSRPCYVRFKYHDWPMAIRARTMTSAGMNRVWMPEQLQHNRKMWSESIQQAAWQTLVPDLFDIHPSQIVQLIQTYFVPGHQQVTLAQQALQGQCTPGHSCKQGAKVALQAMMRHEP